jgi:UDPglucose 6-dehydrogenase
LRSRGAIIQTYDAEAMNNVKGLLGEHEDLVFFNTPYEACDNSDFLIIATEWPEFRSPNFVELIARIKDKVIFDGRNVFDNALAEKHGFSYYSIGRSSHQI